MADQSTSAGTFTHSSDCGSFAQGAPSPGVFVSRKRRNSRASEPSTEHLTPYYSGTNDQSWNSQSVATPSSATPAKRHCVSGPSPSEPGNDKVFRRFDGYSDVGLLSPAGNFTGLSRQISNARSADSYFCPHCSKECSSKSSLRYAFHKPVPQPSIENANDLLDTIRSNIIQTNLPATSALSAAKAFATRRTLDATWKSTTRGAPVSCVQIATNRSHGRTT